jgi:hypothetical protein
MSGFAVLQADLVDPECVMLNRSCLFSTILVT